MDSAGNLYGTTYYGGAYGYGTVFELNPRSGVETVLHSFAGGRDGANPIAGLLLNQDGTVYGVTKNGGDSSCQCGIVFGIKP